MTARRHARNATYSETLKRAMHARGDNERRQQPQHPLPRQLQDPQATPDNSLPCAIIYLSHHLVSRQALRPSCPDSTSLHTSVGMPVELVELLTKWRPFVAGASRPSPDRTSSSSRKAKTEMRLPAHILMDPPYVAFDISHTKV